MHAQSFTHDGPASVYARIDAYNGLFSVALRQSVPTGKPVWALVSPVGRPY